MQATLVMVRHGQSQWNLENRFTGWVDVPLSQKGRDEATSAGKKLCDVHFDTIFVSHMRFKHFIIFFLSCMISGYRFFIMRKNVSKTGSITQEII
jgi:bisphosphoglycerate-dependent phosphoglycerate mutase